MTPTRDRILQAAEDLFAAQGYQGTTINQLASEVGIQGPAIYKHFAGKRALFEEVLESLFEPFIALLEQDQAGAQLAIMQQHLANPNAARIVQHATLSGGEDLALLVERWYQMFFRQTREDLDGGQSPFTAVSIMALHSMLLGYLTLAPLHQAIFGIDPLTAPAVAELLELQAQLVGVATAQD